MSRDNRTAVQQLKTMTRAETEAAKSRVAGYNLADERVGVELIRLDEARRCPAERTRS